MADTAYDVVIVGAGAAGLTAAIYTSRRALKTLVISQDIGGQAATTEEIENYPGVDFSDGPSLMNKFREQAEKFGAEVRLDEVTKIEKQADGTFTVSTPTSSAHGRTVIIAYGLSHKHLDVPGEKEFIGRGVTYCATCDAPLYKGKPVAVVGGGNSAMDAALLLAKLCPEVHMIVRGDALKGEAVMVEKITAANNIQVHTNTVPVSIAGDKTVTGLTVSKADGTDQQTLAVQGVFVEIGFVVKADLVRGLVALDKRNQIIITHENETDVPGIFAAGDITTIANKQIVISAGEGAKAALKAYDYVQKQSGKPAIPTDWGFTPHH
ncbi:MAG: FAD-dependent oxidoreductase [Patescibacteria group bacterium]